MRSIFFFICFILVLNNLVAQPKQRIDSLLQQLKQYQNKKNYTADTNTYNIYSALGDELKKFNPDSAITYYTLAENKAIQLKDLIRQAQAIRNKGWCYYIKSDYTKALTQYKQGLQVLEKVQLDNENKKNVYATIVGNIGIVYHNQGDYTKASDYYLKALAINEEIGNKQGQAANLGNIGIIYKEQGNYTKALDYYFKALAMNEELGNKQGQTANLGNIGNIYSNQEHYTKALDYYFKALAINEEMGNKRGQAVNLISIGLTYSNQGDYTKALNYYFKALAINGEIGNKQGQAVNFGNIGLTYFDQGDYTKALDYYLKALTINEEIGNKQSQAINLGNIGLVYLKLKQYPLAQKYLLQAIQMGEELKIIYHLQDFYYSLSTLYEQTHRHQQSLEAYKKHISYKDSVNSKENKKALIQKEMQYQFEKQQAEEKANHQQELLKKEAQQKQQRLYTYLALSLAGSILIILLIVFKSLQTTKKQKLIIQMAHNEIAEQKKIVEEKNKDILDSITYAKRIQTAILPNENKWKQLLPNSFVLYLPKDIVAGDFYWLEETENYIYIAAADCTGHGVPGAMVSVVCSNALTKSLLEDKKIHMDEILNRTRELVVEKLSGSDTHIRDGMDICLIRIDKKDRRRIQYSGANRSLYYVSNERLEEISPDKQPIGYNEESREYKREEIELQHGSRLYLNTDGFADQFGGEKGKKIGTKKFKEQLLVISLVDIKEAGNVLEDYYKNWKQKEEQTDDVTIIGIEITAHS